MVNNQTYEITITGKKNREWQGSVYFPASGERQSFRSLLELFQVIERGVMPVYKMWKELES